MELSERHEFEAQGDTNGLGKRVLHGMYAHPVSMEQNQACGNSILASCGTPSTVLPSVRHVGRL